MSCDAEILCKDFCLCVGRYLMIATGVPLPPSDHHCVSRVSQNFTSYSHIDHVTFYLIDGATGKVSDHVDIHE